LPQESRKTINWTRVISLLVLVPLLLGKPNAAIAAGPTYISTILSDQPAAYWRLDETTGNAIDLTGNGHNGTYGASVARNVPGLLANDGDTAVQFGAKNDSTNSIQIPGWERGTAGFSVEFWVQFNSFPANEFENLVGDGAGALNFNFMVYRVISDSRILAHCQTTYRYYTLTSVTSFKTGEAHHVVSTCDGHFLRLYIDGTEDPASPVAVIGTLVNTSNPVFIGKDLRESTPSAVIDEVAIYNRALTADQVAKHFQTAVGGLVSNLGPVPDPVPSTPALPGQWTLFGPSSAYFNNQVSSGAVTALAVNPQNSDVVYAAVKNGGIWKTGDGGKTWNATTDSLGGDGFSLGAIAIDPTNPDTVYAIGAPYDIQLVIPVVGAPPPTPPTSVVLKTTDGGASWTAMFGTIQAGAGLFSLSVSPFDSTNVLSLTATGVFVSFDGGNTWQNTLKTAQINAALGTVVFDPANPSTAYAAMCTAAACTVSRSRDSGKSWTNISDVFLQPSPYLRGIGLVISSGVLYASVDESLNKLLFKTVDQGDSWTQINCQKAGSAFCPTPLAVNPQDPSFLIAANSLSPDTGMYRSVDGGSTWSDFSGAARAHGAGTFSAAFSSDATKLYLSNGAGVWKSSNPRGQANWEALNQGLPILGITSFSVDPSDDPAVFLAGTKENGLLVGRGAGRNSWVASACTDANPQSWSTSTAIDAVNPTNLYGTCSDGRILAANDATATFTLETNGIAAVEKGFISRVVADPSNSQILYTASTTHLYQSMDGAQTWTAILTIGNVGGIAVSPLDSNVVIAGTTFGYIMLTTNALAGANASWTAVVAPPPPPTPDTFGSVTTFAFDPDGSGAVYGSLTDVGVNTSVLHYVRKSVNGGVTWTVNNSSVPLSRLNSFSAIIPDPSLTNTAYVGTEGHGVLQTSDGGTTWSALGTGLPQSAVITSLFLHNPTRTLYAATSGRSVWKLVLDGVRPKGQQSFTISDLGAASSTTSGVNPGAEAGYARIHLEAGKTTPAGLAIFAYRENNVLVSEATVPATPLSNGGYVCAQASGTVKAGVAIVNPNAFQNTLTLTATDSGGHPVAGTPTTVTMPPHVQIASFLDQAPFNVETPFDGCVKISGPNIALVGLRGIYNERGEFLLSTLPILPSLADVQVNASIIPHFADGGGWTNEIVLFNAFPTSATGTVRFLGQGSATTPAQPVSVTINGSMNNSFPFTIPGNGMVRLTTSGLGNAPTVGSIQIQTTSGQQPAAFSIFSFKANGVTVSAASVPAISPASVFRMYAEVSGTAGPVVGLAIANPSGASVVATLTLTDLNGNPIGLTGSVTIPANGQIATYLNQVPGLESLPLPFQGLLRMSTSSTSGISPIGLRSRYNERGDLLITTILPVVENSPSSADDLFFPHFADGGGFTTQFILFNGSGPQTSTGTLRFFSQDGHSLDVIPQ
jgi:photosystem II stability/assembly factor-like uncharacterized protein